MEAERRLSAAAQARQAALLPGLLREVRARRRRRYVRRAALAALLVAGSAFAWAASAHTPSRDQVHGDAPREVAAAPHWTTVHDDPAILARCEVASHERPEWLLTDEALGTALRAADRPDGLVRANGHVFVDPAAIDPWPGESP